MAMGNIKRTLKYGTNAVILIVTVVAIAILLNIAVVMFDYKIDMTPGQIFSITSVTKSIVNSIPGTQKVEIYGLFDNTKQKKNLDYNSWVELLNVYKSESNGKLNVIYKDPVEFPKVYADIGYVPETQDAKNPAVFVFRSVDGAKVKSKVIYANDLYVSLQNEKQETVGRQINSEQVFTGAIKYISTNLTPKIYFLQGHKESLPQNNFTKLMFSLENNNYSAGSLNLQTQDIVPKDCKILFVLSPLNDLTSDEKDKIFEYIDNGGSVCYVFDAAFNKKVKYENFQKLLDNYGIEIKNDIVLETNTNLIINDPKDSFVAAITGVQINIGFEQQVVQVINSRSFDLSSHKVEGIESTSLIATSPYAESTDILTGKKFKAVQNIMVGGTRIANEKTSKVIVLGSSGFISDKVSSNFLERNSSYFLNILNWLSNIEDENIVSPKQIDNYTFKLEEGPGVILMVGTIIVLPLIILGAGLFVFLRRRHL